MNPTDDHYDAARAWLEEHVTHWTVGQWVYLALLLAEQAQ